MSLESLVEDSVIQDLQRDSVLQQQPIRKHDYSREIGGDDQFSAAESTTVIVVTGTDRGEFKMGSGIRNIGLEVKIKVNADSDGFTGTLLDDLTERVRFRLMPSPTVGFFPGREIPLSGARLKVFGIMNGDATQRIDSGLERIRIVPATIIASQIG